MWGWISVPVEKLPVYFCSNKAIRGCDRLERETTNQKGRKLSQGRPEFWHAPLSWVTFPTVFILFEQNSRCHNFSCFASCVGGEPRIWWRRPFNRLKTGQTAFEGSKEKVRFYRLSMEVCSKLPMPRKTLA